MTTDTTPPPNSLAAKRSAIHYVSNKDLFIAMKEYIEQVKAAEAKGEERPNPSKYICECFIKIANKYANRPNFNRYTYKDEMIGDAIMTCIARCHKFDPNVSNNPFAYFTQYCHNAFIQRIRKEKKQTSVKAKYISETLSSEFFSTNFDEEGEEFKNNFIEFLKENSVYEDTIVKEKEKKKEAKKKKQEDTVDLFSLDEPETTDADESVDPFVNSDLDAEDEY